MFVCALLFGALFIAGTNCNVYSDLITLPDSPFQHWSWRSNPFLSQASSNVEELDSESSAEKREPLSPDYKEPVKQPSDKKDPEQSPPKPSFNPAIVPGGVLDIYSDGESYNNPFLNVPKFSELDANFGFGFGGSAEAPAPGGGTGLFGLGGFFGFPGEYRPWWKGDNVCIEREETTDDDDDETTEIEKGEPKPERGPNPFSTSISLSNCQQTPNKYECVTKINNHGVSKTFTVRYKCCYGFERSEGSNGCNKKIELKSLAETIDDLDGKEFKSMINMVGLTENIEKDNYTIFLPTDASLAEYEEKISDMNRVDPVRRRRDAVATRDLVRNHFVSGFIDINDLTNEELIYSENDNKTIRINTYPTLTYGKMVTANCAQIKKSNNLAKNGIVHTLDGVIQPASQSILELIADNGLLSNLKSVLESTNLAEFIKEDGHYTIFAPTNAAFDKLDDLTKQKLLKGKACAATILKHHIVRNTVCSSAIIGNTTTHNVYGNIINMERTIENKLIIEDTATIEKADIIATNGVIHMIDSIIIPETALYLNDALKKHNMTKFQELIKEAEFIEDMDAFENATVFAPSNKALEKPETQKLLDEIRGDKGKLREFIKYHTVKGKYPIGDTENNDVLDTELEGKSLRVNLYSTLPFFTNIINRATINCAKIINYDEKSCGSVIHEIDGVLTPTDNTIYDVILNGENYTTLAKIMKDTEIEKILKDPKRTITFVAPDDEAFKNIDEADLNTLLDDKEKATAVLKNHILTEILCCAGVGPQTWGFNSVVPALSGTHQQISRSGGNYIRVGRAVITHCDTTATNGAVHTINRVLFPQRPASSHFGLFLFDI